MTRLWVGLLAALATVDGEKAGPEPPKADVRGVVVVVKEVPSVVYYAYMHVKGKKEADTKYADVVVTIGPGAKFARWTGTKKVKARFEDLKLGCKVQCDIGVPVGKALARIVQAPLVEVLILETPKK